MFSQPDKGEHTSAITSVFANDLNATDLDIIVRDGIAYMNLKHISNYLGMRIDNAIKRITKNEILYSGHYFAKEVISRHSSTWRNVTEMPKTRKARGATKEIEYYLDDVAIMIFVNTLTAKKYDTEKRKLIETFQRGTAEQASARNKPPQITQQQIDMIKNKLRGEMYPDILREMARDGAAISYNVMKHVYKTILKGRPDLIKIIQADTINLNRMIFGMHKLGISDRGNPRQLHALMVARVLNAALIHSGKNMMKHERMEIVSRIIHDTFPDLKLEQLLPEPKPRKRIATNVSNYTYIDS